MKERLTGVGLAVGTALTLGMIWADSAQAFSLGSSVTATNSVKNVNTQIETVFEISAPQTVGPDLELDQFGGIWDIDLQNNMIEFSLNSKFGNVISGDDIYRLEALDFGGLGQRSVTGFNVVYTGSRPFGLNPVFRLIGGNVIEVLFPLGFAQDLTSFPEKGLAFEINLTVAEPPTAVPSPALLPGLVGMGLAVLRQRRDHNSAN